MSLTLPSSIKESFHEENWLVQLYYGDSSNFTGISFKDTTVSVPYHGCILNSPSIRDSIDVYNKKAKMSNISLTCANFKIDGDDFSAKLYATEYINRDVKVYLQPNQVSSLSDCLLIYTGRLENISHDQEKINLQIISKQPWDNVVIPSVKTAKGNYFPVVYGSYAVNSSTYGSPAYAETLAKTVHPVKVDKASYFYYPLVHEDYGSTDTTLHYYEPGLDSFIPLEDSNNAESYESLGYVVPSKWDVKRHFKAKPISFIGSVAWTNSSNAIDGTADQDENDSGATIDFGGNQSTSAPFTVELTKTNVVNFTQTDDPPLLASSDGTNNHGLTLEVNWKATNVYIITNSGATVDENSIHLTETAGSSTFTNGFALLQNNASARVVDGSEDASSGVTVSNQTASTQLSDEYKSTGGYPDGIKLKWARKGVGDAGDTSLMKIVNSDNANQVSVFDIRAKYTLAIDKLNDSTDGVARVSSVKKLYSGHDGFSKSYTGGSGTAATGLEAHRDLLKRFAGVDDSDGNIVNWSAIEADRITDAWNIRWWTDKQTPLIKVLEQIQKEFRFIFKYRSNSMAYFHIKDSYSGSDVAQTLDKNDISSLSVKYTPVKSLVTDLTVNYEKHPALGTYMSSATDNDSTIRTNYNIASSENKIVHNLEMLVNNVDSDLDDDPNDGYIAEVGHLQSNLRIVINCEIVNNYKGYTLEAGDIILFDNSNMHTKPFNLAWTNRYFMITSVSRKVGQTNIEALEVS